MDEIDYKYVLANLLEIERKILKEYDYDKELASKHTGYNEIAALSEEITEIIKQKEEDETVENSFL